MDPKRKPIAIIPLNEHVNKLTPNDILPYLLDQCSTDLIQPHKKNLFLQQVVVNTETHSWTMCREGGTLEHSPLTGKSLIQASLQGLGIYTEMEIERLGVRGGKYSKETAVS